MKVWFRSVLLLCLALAALSQTQMSVAQMAALIKDELANHRHNDKQLAAAVEKLHITEKLTDKTIGDLVAQGAGPKTVAALKALRDQTANMKPPPQNAAHAPEAIEPPPDSARYQEILESMKEYAMNYTQHLPNFMCVQKISRAVDPNAGNDYRSLGVVLARVSYNEGHEEYKVYSVNGKLTDDRSMENIGGGGARSTGEFGSLMREIFESKSDADFSWSQWTTLRGRRMAVFNYSIDAAHSNWSISYGASEHDEQRMITAYKGLIYADPKTGEIGRIKFVAVDIPKSFPVNDTTEILDYDLVDISGQKYVVPMMAQLFMHAGRESAKNEIEFRLYRKYDTSSVIKYDIDPNALPAGQTEQPADPAKPPAKGANPPQ